jgi:hypothetical protein
MSSELLGQAAATRELAKRARRLAIGVGDVDRARLLLHAEELDSQATELERKFASPPKP